MKYLLLLPFLLVCLEIQSQALFEKGASGFHVGAQFASTDASSIVAISPGYTSNGKVTFGITVGFESFDILTINSTGVRPYLSYLAIRQGENDMPISVGVSAAYQYNTFSDDLDLTANIISFGFGIIHEIEAGKNVKIFPGGSVGWERTTFSLPGFMEDSSDIFYGLSTTLLFAKKFSITPRLKFVDRDSQFHLSLGLLFPK